MDKIGTFREGPEKEGGRGDGGGIGFGQKTEKNGIRPNKGGQSTLLEGEPRQTEHARTFIGSAKMKKKFNKKVQKKNSFTGP